MLAAAASRESGDGMAGIRWQKTPRWAPSTGNKINKRDPRLYMEL